MYGNDLLGKLWPAVDSRGRPRVRILPHRWVPGATATAAVIGIALALCDLGVGGARTPTLRRQTQPLWWYTLGHVGAMFLWGLDLGLGFTTIRVASLYWAIALVVFTFASPLAGALVFGGYGVALALNMGIGTLILERKQYANAHTVCILRSSQLIKGGLAFALILWSGMVLVSVGTAWVA